jgi:hypothetical protein
VSGRDPAAKDVLASAFPARLSLGPDLGVLDITNNIK